MDKNSLPLALLSQGPIRLDGVTYYLHGNKVRSCYSKRGPKKSRSAGEAASSDRFTEARKMWRVYRRATGELPIWRVWAKESGVAKSDSAFHSVNGTCFRPGEGVWAFSTFRFSMGSLPAPVITSAVREGWQVVLRWENDANGARANLSDRVYVGYFYGTLPRSPRFVENTGALRRDGEVVVAIPPVDLPEGTPLHLYLFFGGEDSARFSPSEYVEL